jgi:hypothetical protein
MSKGPVHINGGWLCWLQNVHMLLLLQSERIIRWLKNKELDNADDQALQCQTHW